MRKNKKAKKIIVTFLPIAIASMLLLPGSNAGATQITDLLRLAFSYIGTPYVWGGSQPGGFDCSGLTSYVYKHSLGIDIGRTTYDQIYSGRNVTGQKYQPGDLIFPRADIGHVQFYVGNNIILHAPQTGDVVRFADFYGANGGARRIVADSPMEEEIFDYKYYADTYPDLKAAYGYDYGSLYSHYIRCGIGEGRRPSEIFDPAYYLNANSDLKNIFGNDYQAAYDHFVTYGYKENRSTAPDCNIGSYRNLHPEVNSMNDLDLYQVLKDINKIERVMFDYKYYADTYPDLKAAYGYNYGALYNHYITCGIDEGRKPSAIFDPVYYLNNNLDFNGTWVNNYRQAYNHFISSGYTENRKTTDQCDINEYKNMHSELENSSNVEAYKAYIKNPESTNSYTVKFIDLNGKQIGETYKIYEGKSVQAPEATEIDGYKFKRWSESLDNVKHNLNVYAIYSKLETNKEVTTGTPATKTPATDTPADKNATSNKNNGNNQSNDKNASNDNNESNNGNKVIQDSQQSEDNKNNSDSLNEGEEMIYSPYKNAIVPVSSLGTYDSHNILFAISFIVFGSLLFILKKRKTN